MAGASGRREGCAAFFVGLAIAGVAALLFWWEIAIGNAEPSWRVDAGVVLIIVFALPCMLYGAWGFFFGKDD